MLINRVWLALVAALLFALLPISAKDEGFAGRWVLDSKTTQGDPIPEGLEQKIKQNGSALSFETKFPEPKNGIVPLVYLGVMVSELSLNTDGQEMKTQVGPFAMAFKTTMNGNTMETDWSGVVNGDPIQGHWTRTLSPDGQRCTLQIKESSTKGQAGEATLVFVRK